MDATPEQELEMKSRNPVEYIRSLLGHDAVLLPIARGRKAPAIAGWTTLTKVVMEDEQYIAQLGSGNIGVLLGRASNGLCSIDIDSDEAMDAFLALNPRLVSTLRTRRSRGCNLWLRVRGTFPPLTKLVRPDESDWGEWRADGGQTVIHCEVDGVPYRMLVLAPPVEMSFHEIVWPPELRGKFGQEPDEEPEDGTPSGPEADLARDYGMPTFLNSKGTISALNERYFAGLHALEHRILHEPAEQTFYRYETASGLWRAVTQDSIKEALGSRLLRYSEESESVPAFEKLINQKNLTAITNSLKGIVEEAGVFSDKQPVIHVANGMIRFRDDGGVDFGGFAPSFYSRNRSPIEFRADAECPRFVNELIRQAMSEEDADLLQRFSGLALFGYNLPQRLLILDGTPGGGKGTFTNVLCSLVGTENYYQLRTSLLTERFETYR